VTVPGVVQTRRTSDAGGRTDDGVVQKSTQTTRMLCYTHIRPRAQFVDLSDILSLIVSTFSVIMP